MLLPDLALWIVVGAVAAWLLDSVQRWRRLRRIVLRDQARTDRARQLARHRLGLPDLQP